ncbi:MAG: peptide-methionine (S)-S-oxide reductase MsrA [bacterium]
MKSIALLLAPLMMASLSFANGKYETAVFAGGCFWCVQPVFDHISGVIKSEAGYANGKEPSPTYEDYTEKGYVEAVRVTYDPQKTTYAILLSEFWKQIDPTDSEGQFVDRGAQYRPAIFYKDSAQKKTAENYKAEMQKSGRYNRPLTVEISKAENFFAAEDYHQDYHKKSPLNYNIYRAGSGRDAYLKKIWLDKK